MSAKTSIEWTATVHPDGSVTPGKTWNPVTGCTKVSPGCAHCYAEVVAARFWPSQYPPVEYETYSVDTCCPVTEMRSRQFTDVQTHEDRLLEPSRWRKPARVFVNSMSDLFHESIDPLFIGRVLNIMGAERRHTFQVLTKRPARMKQVVDAYYGNSPYGPLPNVWLGVSVENQHFADERIPLLLQTPAAVRFISAEPLLGPVDLSTHLGIAPNHDDLHGLLNWVIVGGESGPKARPFDLAWARSIVQQCQAAGVPVFVKQLGAEPFDSGAVHLPADAMFIRDRKGGDPAEWPADLRVREFPEVRA